MGVVGKERRLLYKRRVLEVGSCRRNHLKHEIQSMLFEKRGTGYLPQHMSKLTKNDFAGV
jgi:hypothetical protein